MSTPEARCVGFVVRRVQQQAASAYPRPGRGTTILEMNPLPVDRDGARVRHHASFRTQRRELVAVAGERDREEDLARNRGWSPRCSRPRRPRRPDARLVSKACDCLRVHAGRGRPPGRGERHHQPTPVMRSQNSVAGCACVCDELHCRQRWTSERLRHPRRRARKPHPHTSRPVPTLRRPRARSSEECVRWQIPTRRVDRELPKQARMQFGSDGSQVGICGRRELWPDLPHCNEETVDEPRRPVRGRDVGDRHRAPGAKHEPATCAGVDGI